VPTFSELVRYVMHTGIYERSREYEFTVKYLMPLLVLPRPYRKSIRILDVGGADSRLSKWLSEEGFDVYVIDIREDDYGNARFIKANILEHEFPSEYFDIIVAVSTVEHVGLNCYGQRIEDPDGDIKTMEKLKRWLRTEGLLILTVPYGRPHHPPTFERVYNPTNLWRLQLDDMDIIERRFYCYNPRDPHNFLECTEQKALTTDAVMCVATRKTVKYV